MAGTQKNVPAACCCGECCTDGWACLAKGLGRFFGDTSDWVAAKAGISCSGIDLHTGTETNTYAATTSDNGMYHGVAADGGVILFDYLFDVSTTGNTISNIVWRGYVQTTGDTLYFQYYDWVLASYVTLLTQGGASGTSESGRSFDIPVSGTGTGANLGIVKFRLSSTTATNVATDYLYATCAVSSSAASSAMLSLTDYPYNVLLTRSAGDHGTVNPYHQHSVRSQIEATYSGVIFRLIVTALDADNYLAVEIEIGDDSGVMRLIECVSGSTTSLTGDHVIPSLCPNTRLWVAGDFDDGEFRGRVGTTKNGEGNGQLDQYGTYDSITENEVWFADTTNWVRWTRVDQLAYTGTKAGWSVSGNASGTVRLHEWEAGCSAVFEFCEYEHDSSVYRNTSWASSHWNVVSGYPPIRAAWPVTWPNAFDMPFAMKTTGSGSGAGTGNTHLLHRNPIPSVYANCHQIRNHFYVDYLTISGGDFAIGTYIGCNDGGTQGYCMRWNYAFILGDAFGLLYSLSIGIYDLSGTLIDARTPFNIAIAYDSGTGRYRGLVGPVRAYIVGNQIRDHLGLVNAAGTAYGGYGGMLMEPPASGVLLTNNYRVLRCSYSSDDDHYSEPEGCSANAPTD